MLRSQACSCAVGTCCRWLVLLADDLSLPPLPPLRQDAEGADAAAGHADQDEHDHPDDDADHDLDHPAEKELEENVHMDSFATFFLKLGIRSFLRGCCLALFFILNEPMLFFLPHKCNIGFLCCFYQS